MVAGNTPRPLVVIVGLDKQQAQGLAQGIRALGYRVQVTSSALDGLLVIEDRRPALVVLRWRVDERDRGTIIDSDVMLRAMKRALPTPPLTIAVVDSMEEASEAMRLGASDYVVADSNTTSLARNLQSLLRRLEVAP